MQNVKDVKPTFADGTVEFNVQLEKYVARGNDGVNYEWDDQKKAWFPMFDESLVSQQQSVYAVEGVADEHGEGAIPQKRKNKEKKKQEKPKRNTAVYVSGLPLDVTVEEMEETFGKCGVILEDIETGEKKIKLYKDEQGTFKGDALVIYFKEESIKLAVDLLDETEFRYGCGIKMRVQPAVFQGEEKKRRIDKTFIKAKMTKLTRKLEWDEEETKAAKSVKKGKVVVLKHMFTLQELEDDVTLLLDLKEDVRAECEKMGPVTSVRIFDRNPDGAMLVKFTEEAAAAACVKVMNGRFFGGRKVDAYLWNGREKFEEVNFNFDEDGDEEERRLENFSNWLETQGDET